MASSYANDDSFVFWMYQRRLIFQYISVCNGVVFRTFL